MKTDKMIELEDYFNTFPLKTIKRDLAEHKRYRSNKKELARILTKVNNKENSGEK